ncbi:hypothetical protein FBD94_13130 [Pedobacter hiemivivus]|uniref:Uncharacterized protein n=1 Tax=Pedobacter hiemivivus TaxID=2530454 RepID=A0A4V5PDM3_9SPHI|nr:hypothetical protein [Pedobacter hiemivivus]TKC61466.1 hypothetical protein FBD94_13130 [Pedobacter hiemivivus]
MKLKTLVYPLIALLMVAGCKKEAAIMPDTITPEYSLPQGNHPYDTQIVDFYQTYGCYMLYKFTEKDFNWNISNKLSYVADQGDENYIVPALAALDKYLFKYYSSDFLKKALPYKIILSARIREIVDRTDTLATPVNSVSTFSHFAFGHAGSSLAGMTENELKVMKVDLHREFWMQAVSLGKIPLPPTFVRATNYEDVFSWTAKANGVFFPTANGVATNVYTDFEGYMNVIASKTVEELEQSLFKPLNDPNGKYKLKYNMIISYYKTVYGIDLQGITR